MLFEMHSLTSHAPANLNRDDLGRPKSAFFGGVQRSRISSQAIKRSIRTSNWLAEKMNDKLSTRSRQIPKMIFDDLSKKMNGDEKKIERLQKVCDAFTGAIGKPDKKRELHTSQIVFLTPKEIEKAKSHILAFVEGDDKLAATSLKNFTANAAVEIGLNRNSGDGVDMALFGRMTTDDANSFASVDASMQVAHAISTHGVSIETDWFTAVDDVRSDDEERGSGHIGEVEFNSAVYYKYFSCNLPLMVRNMNGAREEAIESLANVLDAACRVTPSGKQNSFASHAVADTVLLLHRPERIPVSLANAFERPVANNSEKGYLADSRARLAAHYAELKQGYDLSDHAAFFCVDAGARKELEETLPKGTKIVGSLNELFDWMRTHAKNELPESTEVEETA